MKKKLLIFGQSFGIQELSPLGPFYLEAYMEKYTKPELLEKLDIVIEMADTATHIYNDKKRLKKDLEIIRKHNPDVLGLSIYTTSYTYWKKLLKELKTQMKITIIGGGPHLTTFPNKLNENLDIGIIGEGEQTMLELMELYLSENGFPKEKLKEIKGISYRENEELVLTPHRELIDPLDKIPYPYRESIDRGNTNIEICGILTSRGCPYKCVFCQSRLIWGRVRMNSAEYVVNEVLSLLERYPTLKKIIIYDDLFAINKKRLKEIVQWIEKQGINKRIKFDISCRTDLFDEEMAQLLKRMNADELFFGFESGSDRILRWLKADTTTVADNHNAYALAVKYGFAVHGSFMVGCPGETKEDLMKTYEFIKAHPMKTFSAQIAVPLPGTELWNIAKKRGIVSEDMDFDELWDFEVADYLPNYDKYKKLLLTEEVSREEFYKIYQKFMKLFVEEGSRASKNPIKKILFRSGVVWRYPKFWYNLKKFGRMLKG